MASKNIVKDLQAIQDEIKELRNYKKSVQKYLQKGADFLDEKQAEKVSSFEAKICLYYGLKSEAEKQRWLDVMLNDHSKNFWERQTDTN